MSAPYSTRLPAMRAMLVAGSQLLLNCLLEPDVVGTVEDLELVKDHGRGSGVLWAQ